MRSDARSAGQGTGAHGFTVVEVLVALVLLSVGLLALAGAGALAVRTSGDAARERRAVQRGADRLAILRAAGCASARGGSAADPVLPLAERWTASPAPTGVVLVVEEVRWTTSRGSRTVLLRGALLC
jgi:prepilin-type N-terminal cleavage/methylation domain-containing protein